MNNYPDNVIVVTPAGMVRLSVLFIYEEIMDMLINERLLNLDADSSPLEYESALLSVDTKLEQLLPMFQDPADDWTIWFSDLVEKAKEINLFNMEDSEIVEVLSALCSRTGPRVLAAINSLMPETDEDPMERLLRFRSAVFSAESEDLDQ